MAKPRPALRIAFLAAALLGVCAVYLFWNLSGNVGFILPLRARKLAAMLTVGTAIALSTILFQTVSNNRILTPAIMGFDALYLLIQTGLVATLGVTGFVGLPSGAKFFAETGVMMAAGLSLSLLLLGAGRRDINRMILTGVILGILFRSLSGLLARMLDPNAYSVVQSVSFASFGSVDAGLLPFGIGLTALVALVCAWMAQRLDVMALGRDTATSLGLRFAPMTIAVLAAVAVLVSVSTALVGPIAFFGLVVSGLAHGLIRDNRHALLLPAASLVAGLVLVSGQTLFERMLGLQSVLSVVVEFLGGMFFLWLLMRGQVR